MYISGFIIRHINTFVKNVRDTSSTSNINKQTNSACIWMPNINRNSQPAVAQINPDELLCLHNSVLH